MTPEERQMLTDLANKIAQTPSPAHDAEAEDFIRTHIGNRPDALYLMTQTVLIQNMAIEHAQQEIQQLKQQAPAAPAAPGGGGFLGHGGGWATLGSPSPQPAPPPQQPAYYQPPQQQVPVTPSMPQSGMGSFLRSAGTTAAGIAAGALAFEGIRSMFGGVEHMFGFGNQPQYGGSGFLGGGGYGGGRPMEETVVNNYYDTPGGREPVAGDLGPDDRTNYDDTNVTDPSDDKADDIADDTSDDTNSDSDDSSSFDDNSSSNDDSV